MTEINCERDRDIEKYLTDIIEKDKFFTFVSVVEKKDYEPNEIFSRIKYMVKFDRLSQIFIEHPQIPNHTSNGFYIYTTPKYSESQEVKDFLSSMGMSDVEIKLSINKAKYLRSDGADGVKRTARRSATMNDIAIKGNIVKTIKRKGEATIHEVADELGLEMPKARALFSSLAIGKFIKYNASTKKYTALRDKF